MKTPSIDRARVEFIAGKILDFLEANRALAMDVDQWKTIKGAKVLIGEGGEVKAGMGGKFTGRKIEALGQKEAAAAKDWPENFPNVTALTTVSKMKAHPHYQAAKAGEA